VKTSSHDTIPPEREAFETVYRTHYISIYHFAKKFVRDAQVAEDITTEAFLKLWERFSKFSNPQTMKSFLFTVAHNACINHARGEQRLAAREAEFSHLYVADAGDRLAEEEIRGRVYQHIYAEIEKLPAQEKRVFKMAYVEGLSNEEIAAQLGINNQSVRNHKARALKTLRLSLLGKNIFAFLVVVFWLKHLKS